MLNVLSQADLVVGTAVGEWPAVRLGTVGQQTGAAVAGERPDPVECQARV
jgi:hypothetical protein